MLPLCVPTIYSRLAYTQGACNMGPGVAYHLVPCHHKSARRVAIPIGWAQITRQAAVLELRLLVRVVVVVVFSLRVVVGTVLAIAGHFLES